MAEVPPFLWGDTGTFASPKTYTVPGSGEVQPYTAHATYDGTGASGTFRPCLTFKSQNGIVLGRYFPADTVATGNIAEVTFTPPFGSAPVSAPSPTPPVGQVRLIYDYTVTGSDKASINTAVDGVLAGSFPNDLNYLEAFLSGRTDEAGTAPFVVPVTVDFQLNGDTGANYSRVFIASSVGGAPGQGQVVSATSIQGVLAGSSAAANFGGLCRFFIPNYNGTTFYKITEFTSWALDNSAATSHYQIGLESAVWANASAVTSLSTFPDTAGKKFKVGTRLSIWGR